jgi:hypothetical protein
VANSANIPEDKDISLSFIKPNCVAFYISKCVFTDAGYLTFI